MDRFEDALAVAGTCSCVETLVNWATGWVNLCCVSLASRDTCSSITPSSELAKGMLPCPDPLTVSDPTEAVPQ